MAYTILRSDGTVLTTIQDGTINTQSTSLGLPGRNKSNYGQVLDQNFVKQLESYASPSPPTNPLRGQLWYNTNTNTLCVCPADGTLVASNWITLTSTTAAGNATLANINATGNIIANNITSNNAIIGNSITVTTANVTGNLFAANANLTSARLGTAVTTAINTASPINVLTAGVMTGAWAVQGNWTFQNGDITFSSGNNGVRSDKYMYANGANYNPSGTYTNANVGAYLTGNGVTSFSTQYGTNANIQLNKLTANIIDGGGNINGIWQLGTGARLQATYADLAERFEADQPYEAGTVVELGGVAEITAVTDELSNNVFGVISTSAAYMMNSAAGNDDTHPAVAMSGRVPVKVKGKVKKGDRLVSAGEGIARAAKEGEASSFNVIGRSLTTKTTEGVGEITAVVVIK
jgi:hypothetical protein